MDDRKVRWRDVSYGLAVAAVVMWPIWLGAIAIIAYALGGSPQ